MIKDIDKKNFDKRIFKQINKIIFYNKIKPFDKINLIKFEDFMQDYNNIADIDMRLFLYTKNIKQTVYHSINAMKQPNDYYAQINKTTNLPYNLLLHFACSELLKEEISNSMNRILGCETTEYSKNIYEYMINHLTQFLSNNVYDYTILNNKKINRIEKQNY